MTVTNESGNRQNVFAKEPRMIVKDVEVNHNEKAEMLNGRLAMIGMIAALGAHITTDHIIPGVF